MNETCVKCGFDIPEPSELELKDLKQGFGRMTIEDLAASMYHTFHGECDCTRHPWNNDGTPWKRNSPEYDDLVVEGFRRAAIAAKKVLKDMQIGSWD